MCKLVCRKAPPGRYRTPEEIEDTVRMALLREGHDSGDMTFDELRWSVEQQAP
jgi:hypothetical protein